MHRNLLSVIGCLLMLSGVLLMQSTVAVTAQDDPTPEPPLVSIIEINDDEETDDEALESTVAEDVVQALAESRAEEAALEARSLTILFFEADWCPYCKEQRPVMDDLVAQFEETVLVLPIDIEDAENRVLVREYNVTAIPRLIMLDQRGRVKEDYLGYTARRVLQRDIRASLLNLSPLGETTQSGLDLLQ